MTSDATLFTFANSTDLVLEISPTAGNEAWLNSQSFSNPASRYQAYLNQLCLSAVLPWLQEDYALQAKPWPHVTALSSIWEVVNGIAITLDTTRFILVPSEAIDSGELRVPQEWIDSPSWAGDYYLAIQVEPDEGWVRIWGYCTHEQLKHQGRYQASDRTYCLDEDDMIRDVSILGVVRQLYPDAPTRATITPLAALPLAQANNLLHRLSNPAVTMPRLEIPFELWGALIEHGAWRQRLYEQRIGLPEQRSILQWLRTGVSSLAQQMGWGRIEFQPSLDGARGIEESTDNSAILSRQLLIAGQRYELRVVPINREENIWRFELHNATVGGLIPGGFKLRLLAEDLQEFENNEDSATTAQEQLYVEVALAPGEGLVWETQPLPENYDREILRF